VHVKGNLVREIEERILAEKKLQNLYQNLESEVSRRTAELRTTNERMMKEIEERERIDLLLKKSESRMRSILSAMTDMVFAFDDKSRFTFAHIPSDQNPFLPPEFFLGRPHNAVMPVHLHELFNRAFSSITQGKIAEYQYPLEMESGTEWYTAIYSPAYKDGIFDGGVAVVRNVTAIKVQEEKISAMMEELRRSNDELQQFAYVASHDLKDPLVTLGGYLQRLERKYHDEFSASAVDLLCRAFSSVQKMERMIDQLLSYACMRSDKDDHSEVDTACLVSDVVDSLTGLILKEEATVELKSLPVVVGERIMIEQLFQNLISNAIKHRGEKKPVITISAERKDDTWVFFIRDNGSGIPPAYAERIFNLFERLNPKSRDGSGIGLAVCKKIVELHGGRIWVESKPGEGSVFSFTIPSA
jgi:signal transduction histidine kinase